MLIDFGRPPRWNCPTPETNTDSNVSEVAADKTELTKEKVSESRPPQLVSTVDSSTYGVHMLVNLAGPKRLNHCKM